MNPAQLTPPVPIAPLPPFAAMSVAQNPALIDALQALQRDSNRVAEEWDRRLASSPPPCTSASDATASPSTPKGGSGEDSVQRYNRLRSEYTASMPRQQFIAQARRIEERIVHQLKHPGRKETIPHELNTEPRANAQNFLRENWCKQKIWEHGWGPPWPPGRRGPIYGPIGPGYVGNEWSKVTSSKRPRRSLRSALVGREYSAASRPLAQFLFQLQLERRWQVDEVHYTRQQLTPVDLDTMAYRSLRDIWEEDGLWSSSWNVVPGDSDQWLHERMDFATYVTLREDPEGVTAGNTHKQIGSVATSFVPLDAIKLETSRNSSLPPSADEHSAEHVPRRTRALFGGTSDHLQHSKVKILKHARHSTKPRRSSRLNPNASPSASPRDSVCAEPLHTNIPKSAHKARRKRASRGA